MRIIAYYTPNPLYEEHAAELITSCIKYGLKHNVIKTKDRGSWMLNTYYKPEFIKTMMTMYPNEKLIYTDVDSEFCKSPLLFKDEILNGYDIGIRRRKGEYLSGTLIINPKAKPLIDEWVNCVSRFKGSDRDPLEQKILQNILVTGDYKVFHLPSSYCAIKDLDTVSPVVLHKQASRVQRLNEIKVPEMPFKTRIRKNKDGSLWIAKDDPKTEAYMDKNFIRVRKELLWLPKTTNKNLEVFKNKHKDQTIYIIGKGPSLDNIDRLPGVSICVNESVTKFRKNNHAMYGIFQDVEIAEDCVPCDQDIPIFTNTRCQNVLINYPNKYIYDPRAWGYGSTTLTTIIAIKIAQYMGAKTIELVAYDAITNGNLDYAKFIDKDPADGGNVNRFLRHKTEYESAGSVVFSTLGVPNSGASCTLEQ